jgi:hypothetical protein
MERRGVLVATNGEQIAFDGFAVSERLLMLERRAPDAVGARRIMIPYENILAVKLVDVIKSKAFQALGFEEGPRTK